MDGVEKTPPVLQRDKKAQCLSAYRVKMTFVNHILRSTNNKVLKGLHKFKVDMPINAKGITVQSLEHLFIYLYCGCHLGVQKNALQPISPHNTIIENFSTSLACNSVFIWSK